jgi:integrase
VDPSCPAARRAGHGGPARRAPPSPAEATISLDRVTVAVTGLSEAACPSAARSSGHGKPPGIVALRLAGGSHLEAFFACLYYAALRSSEAVMLREADLHLPKKDWGRIDLAGSASRAGTAWTDHGTAHETRTIPIPPELVRLLRANIKRYGTTHDGRIFQTARGGILQDSGYNEV